MDRRLRGTVLVACNCDYGCPCNFNALPTKGFWTWELSEELKPVRYELNLARHRSSLKAGDVVDLELEPIANPVTGAEVHPGAVLHEGLIFKEGSFASSKRFRLRDGISYDHSGHYAAFGPFDYNGP